MSWLWCRCYRLVVCPTSASSCKTHDLTIVPLGQNGCIQVHVVFDRYTPKSRLENEQTGTIHCLRDPDPRPSYISSHAVVKLHNQSSKQYESVHIPGRNMVQHRGRETTNRSLDCSRWWLQGQSEGSRVIKGHFEDWTSLRSDHEEADT